MTITLPVGGDQLPTALHRVSTVTLRALARGAMFRVEADGIATETRALTPEGRKLVRAELTHRRQVRALVSKIERGTYGSTVKGRKLYQEIAKHFYDDARHKTTREDKAHRIEVLCSLLCRLAPAYDRIQVAECNGEKTRYMTGREAEIERRARVIVAAFPQASTGRVSLVLGGDPRGFCMKIKIPNAPGEGNTWGLSGEYGVPT